MHLSIRLSQHCSLTMSSYSTLVKSQLSVDRRAPCGMFSPIALIYASAPCRHYRSVSWSLWLCRKFWNQEVWILQLLLFLIFKILFISFRQRGREGERERNINVWLPLACPLLGTWPTTQACALTGNLPVTLHRFTGRHSIRWPTPAQAVVLSKYCFGYSQFLKFPYIFYDELV